MEQDCLRVLFNMEYEDFCIMLNSIHSKDHGEGYLQEKWKIFNENLARYLIVVSPRDYQKIIEYAFRRDMELRRSLDV